MHDTLIVRWVLVTALNLDPGPHMRWPGNPAKQADPADLPSRHTAARERNVRSGEEGPERLTCGSQRGARIQHGAGVASESVTKINAVTVSALLITEL